MKNTIDINVAAEQFKKELFRTINQAGSTLPPALVYYIVSSAYHEIHSSYQEYLLNISVDKEEQEPVPAETLDDNA